MEQDIDETKDPTPLPDEGIPIPANPPSNRDDPGSPDNAAGPGEKEATDAVPPESATSARWEDAILLVETISEPELGEGSLPPEDVLAGDDGAGAATEAAEGIRAERVGAADARALQESACGAVPSQEMPVSQASWMSLVVGLVAALATLGVGSYALLRKRSRRKRAPKLTRPVTRSLRWLAKR